MVRLKKWNIGIRNTLIIELKGMSINNPRFEDMTMITTTEINRAIIHEEYLILQTQNTDYKLYYEDALIMPGDVPKYNLSNYTESNDDILVVGYLIIINKIIELKESLYTIINSYNDLNYDIELEIKKLVEDAIKDSIFVNEIIASTEDIELLNYVLGKTIYHYIYNFIGMVKESKLKNTEMLIIMSDRAHYNYIEGIGFYNNKLFSLPMDVHLGMFKDSVLVMEHHSDNFDFRYFPGKDKVTIYSIDNITKRIVIYNDGVEPFSISGKGMSVICTPKEYTELVMVSF